ncbi:hypothetical protein CWB98_16950 [Pseudoalteromonas rubra]|uniref:Uncharacterized protein n=1 Tax=Pseudoalteromonas rubra TaxID=43658 RepID=A0A5S3WX21_9GAMM|nr:hypothetical protein CWB98_16950 [Pseudoalteromonas rubra]
MIRENYFNKRASLHCVAIAVIYLVLDIKLLFFGESQTLNFEFLFNVKVFVCFLYLLYSEKITGYFEQEDNLPLDFTLHMTAFLFMLWLMIVPGIFGIAFSKYFGCVLIILLIGSVPILFEVIKCREVNHASFGLVSVELLIKAAFVFCAIVILMYLVSGNWSWEIRPIHTLIKNHYL